MDTKLKRWRGERKAEEVATKLGVTVAMWSRWETEKRAIPPERVLAIEALTGISRHELREDIFGPAKPAQSVEAA